MAKRGAPTRFLSTAECNGLFGPCVDKDVRLGLESNVNDPNADRPQDLRRV
jgi:hypothetical protein